MTVPPSASPVQGADAGRPGAWRCPSCGEVCRGSFCSACGEKRLHSSDLTLRHLAAQAFEAVVQVDGRLWRTARALVAIPGMLTCAWLEGRRRPFFGPVQTFLLANVVFFLAQEVSRLVIVSIPLRVHLAGQFYSEAARRLVAAQLGARHLSLESFTHRFDLLTDIQARTLVVAMAPAFALLCAAVLVSLRRPAAAHLVFSLHFYAFLMLAASALFVAARGAFALLRTWGAVPSPEVADAVLTSAQVALCAAYLWPALGRVYGLRGAGRLAGTVVLAAAVAAVLFGYRLLLFGLTLATA